MYRKWKSVTALGMAALIGCLMPMGTMMAAEENPEAVQEVEEDSETDVVDNSEAISGDNENAGVEEDAGTDENAGDEINADDENADGEVNADDENVDDEVNVDDVIVDDEVNIDNDGIEVMSETEAEAGEEVQASSAAPVIDIKFNGQSSKYDLDGNIDYIYVNNHDQAIECSASQDDQTVLLYYYIDNSGSTTVKGIEGITSWTEASSTSERISFSDDKSYVLYVKAVGADGQTAYARSGGIVVDTVAPDVSISLVNGETYPEGTKFQVVDKNLESVEVNGVDVTSGWNAVYQVSANGTSTSCVIRLKDKAGNEKIYSVNVSKAPADDGVISANGIYALTAGTSYQLGEGQWQVDSDKSVYSGGNTFYVGTDGNYRFTKR